MVHNGSGDLATRSKLFRDSLIEEFRLSESDTLNSFVAPKHSSTLFEDKDLVLDVLRHKPHSLIKFKMFKRNPQQQQEGHCDGVPNGKREKQNRLKKEPKMLSFKTWAQWLASHKYFSRIIIVTILVNAAILGIQTFLDPIENWQEYQRVQVVDHVTVIIFVLEIALKLIADFWLFWKDGWNLFDFFVTAGSLIPALLSLAISEDGNDVSTGNIASLAKNLKIFRTFRTLKMIAKFRSLRIIVRTIVEALQSLGFVLILLVILMYIFAVLAIGLFEDYSKSTIEDLKYQYFFSDMIAAMRTLFQLLTLDQWFNIAKDITRVESIHPIVVIMFFIIWVALGAFIFRNIFIGVMVKNFQSISQELADIDQASRKRAKINKYLKDLQSKIAENHKAIENSSKKKQDDSEPNPKTAWGPDLNVDIPQIGSTAQDNPLGSPFSAASPQSPLSAADELFHDPEKAAQWRSFVQNSLNLFSSSSQDHGTTLWPRDTLLDYLQTMERLQENMKEYQELEQLATAALLDIVANSS